MSKLVAHCGFAAALIILGIAGAGVAHADPTTPDLICLMMRQGYSPEQTAESLYSGNPTVPLYQWRGKVLNQLGNCQPAY